MSLEKEAGTNGEQPRNESLEQQPTHATYIEKDEAANISTEHHEYLVKRHGTADLDPIPAFGDADPYNWPQWKVCFQFYYVLMIRPGRSQHTRNWPI